MAVRSADAMLAAIAISPPPKMLAELAPSADEVRDYRERLGRVARWLTDASADASDQRTGDMCFKADVVNLGDFDGVIVGTGLLKFAKGQFAVDADKYTVVKAHGYEQIAFCYDNVLPAQQDALNAWKMSVRDHEETPYELVLSSADGYALSEKAHLWK